MYIIPGGDRGVGIRRKGSEKCTEDGKRRVGRGFPGWWEKGEREKHNTMLHNILELKVKRGEKKAQTLQKKAQEPYKKLCLTGTAINGPWNSKCLEPLVLPPVHYCHLLERF